MTKYLIQIVVDVELPDFLNVEKPDLQSFDYQLCASTGSAPVEDVVELSSDEELSGIKTTMSNLKGESIGEAVASTSKTAAIDTNKPATNPSRSRSDIETSSEDSDAESSKLQNDHKEGNRMSAKRYGRIVKEVDVFLETWRHESLSLLNPPERDVVFHYLFRLDGIEGKTEIASRLLKMHFGSNPAMAAKNEAMDSVEHNVYIRTLTKEVKDLIKDMDPACDLNDDVLIEGYLKVLDDVIGRVELTAKLLRFCHLNDTIREDQNFVDRDNELDDVFSRGIMRTSCTEELAKKMLTVLRRSNNRALVTADLLDIVSLAIAECKSASSRASKTLVAGQETNNKAIESQRNTLVVSTNDIGPIFECDLNGEYDEIQRALLKDADTIVEIFPHIDRQEAYAYLELHVDRADRVNEVIKTLMLNAPHVKNAAIGKPRYLGPGPDPDEEVSLVHLPPSPQVAQKRNNVDVDDLYSINVPEKKMKMNNLREPQNPNLQEPGPSGMARVTALSVSVQRTNAYSTEEESDEEDDANGNDEQPPLSALEERRENLRAVFPTADPDFLHELVVSCTGDDELLGQKVEQLIQTKNYPLLKDRLVRETMTKMRVEYSTRDFTPQEILEWTSEPLVYFYDTKKVVSKRYRDLVYRELKNRFPKVRDNYLKGLISRHNGHFIPCLRILEDLDWATCSAHCKKSRTRRNDMPLEPDETFYKELAFSRAEPHFRDYLKKIETEKATKMQAARASNSLVTCNCCFDDELLDDDMVTCDRRLHKFCRECVRRGMEVAIGQTKTELKCMTDGCEAKFSMPTLQSVLSASIYGNLVRQLEAAEIEQAQIADLEKCPHCSFAAIMPDHNDKVFRCLNPECLKETCRLCKEPSHIPLRCNEVERESEVRMRTYIENKMSEALMRECPKCQRRFTKEFGCNMMTCICGSKMCYVCRQPVKDYNHFGPNKCPQESNLEQLHHEDVTKGANQAKEEFVTQNPDLENLDLKHDPLKELPLAPPPPQHRPPPHNVPPVRHQVELGGRIEQFGHRIANAVRQLQQPERQVLNLEFEWQVMNAPRPLPTLPLPPTAIRQHVIPARLPAPILQARIFQPAAAAATAAPRQVQMSPATSARNLAASLPATIIARRANTIPGVPTATTAATATAGRPNAAQGAATVAANPFASLSRPTNTYFRFATAPNRPPPAHAPPTHAPAAKAATSRGAIGTDAALFSYTSGKNSSKLENPTDDSSDTDDDDAPHWPDARSKRRK